MQARGLDIADIRRDDFPLPTLGPVLDRLRGEVLDGRGFVLLRGMPVEDRPIAESATAYWGVGTYFGSARSQNAKGHLLGHVYDLGGSSATNPNMRSYATAERQNFHIDRCDVVALLCLRRAKSGGLSAIVSSMTVHNVMAAAPARSAGAAVSAVPGRPPRRGAGGQGAVLRSAGVQRIRRPALGAVFPPAYRLGAALSRGAAADARGYRGARHARPNWRAIPSCGST